MNLLDNLRSNITVNIKGLCRYRCKSAPSPYSWQFNEIASIGKRKLDSNGLLKKRVHKDIFDTRAYVVEFPVGAEAEYTSNIIAQHMYSQYDTDE